MVLSLSSGAQLVWRRSWAAFRTRYSGTSIGLFWHLLHPLATILIYTVVFGYVMQVRGEVYGAPFALFLCVGLIPWLGFQDAVVAGSGCFVSNRIFLRKMPVPEEVFAFEAGTTAAIGLAVSFALVMAAGLILGVRPAASWLLLPVVLGLLVVAGSGLGTACGTLCSFFPDLNQVVQLALRPLFWLAPIVYPLEIVENPKLRALVWAQPVTPFVQAARALFLEGTVPGWELWAAMGGWTVGALAVGLFVLSRLRGEIRDVL